MQRTPAARETNLLIVFLLALLALKFGLVLVDGKPSVFMGDSGSYLYTALHDYIPHDRSFAYGLLLRPLAVWPHSLQFLVFAQAAMSAVSAWLIAVILTRVFFVRFRRAALLSLLCALEPLQLISERYVMTDTPALSLFAVMATISVAFCRRSSQVLLACALLSGVALISIRMSYLPIVLLNSVLLPLVWFWRSTGRRGFRAWALLIVWLGAGQLMLYGYRRVNASVSGMAKPEYLYADGIILVSEVAPILTPSDFPPEAPWQRVIARVGLPLGNPREREGHIFSPRGLTAALRAEVPDEYRANQMAKRIASHAMAAHPINLARLALSTWKEFFDLSQFRGSLVYDEGGLRKSDEDFGHEILQSLGTDLRAQSSDGPVWRWHRAAIPWYWFLVTAPLVIPFVVAWKRRRMDLPSSLIVGYLMLLFVQTIVISTHAEARYLMSVAWLGFLAFGILSRGVVSPGVVSCHLRKRPPFQRPFGDLQIEQTDVIEGPKVVGDDSGATRQP
jgi:hypothetical protein